MTLQEFLATADADHSIALQQARDYVQTEPVLYTANVMTMYIVGAGLYSVFTDTAATVGHPVRDPCLALMDRLRSESEFNLTPGDPMGEANIAMLDGMILGLPDHAAALTALRAQLTAGAAETVYPFLNSTLHDILILRDACPVADVTVDSGHALITTTQDIEKHNPRLMAFNPRLQAWQRASSFYGVAAAGVYEAKIPPEYRAWSMKVDNAYGFII